MPSRAGAVAAVRNIRTPRNKGAKLKSNLQPKATDEEGHETSAPNTHSVGKLLVPAQQQMGEIPPDAIVTAEQTESALGRARSASTVRSLKSSVAVGCPHEVAAGASLTLVAESFNHV